MDPLADQQCDKCGYDLTGLRRAGTCPECGNRYNLRTRVGIRPIQTAEDRALWLGRRLRTIVLALMGAAVLICGGVLHMALSVNRIVPIAIMLGLLCILGAVTSYLYESD